MMAMSMPETSCETPFERRYLAGIALFSCCNILVQLLLTRLFSVTLAYHFAFMVISIVMLTLAAPGALIFAFPRVFSARRFTPQAAGAALAYGCLLFAVLAVYLALNLRVASPHATEWMRPEGRRNIAIIFAMWIVPPLAGGFVPALMLTHFPRRAPSIYGCDLAGAAAGGLLFMGIMKLFSGITAIILAAALLCAAGAVLAGRVRPRIALAGVAAAALLCVFAAANAAMRPHAPVRIRYAKYYKEPEPLIEQWSPISRVTVFGAAAMLPLKPDIGFGWAMSKNYKGPPARELWMEQDAAAGTPITAWDGVTTSGVEHVLWDITSIAHHVTRPQSMFVIGAGGGRDILAGILAGAREIRGAEMNPASFSIVRDDLSSFTGRLYSNPRVRIIHDEGRATLRAGGQNYDMIQISLVDSQTASAAGALVFVENLLYTREAFETYLGHLTAGGAVSISWYFIGTPPGMLYRMLMAPADALRRKGIANPMAHILLFRNGIGATYLVKRAPWRPDEVDRARAESKRLGFDLIMDAQSLPADRDLADIVTNPKALMARYPLNLSAPTDDSPFVFQLEKWDTDPAKVSPDLRANLVGTRVLRPLLWLMAAASAVLILLPLAWRTLLARRGGHGGPPPIAAPASLAWPAIAVAGGCGMGYLVAELALMHLGSLIVGYPVYALVLTLVALLLGSGAGSAFSGRYEPARLARSLGWIMIVLAGVIAAIPPLRPAIQDAAAAMPWAGRACMIFGVCFVTGFFMGMPFPTLMRLVDRSGAGGLLPWLWGLNGMAGVMSSIVVMCIAVFSGYSTAMYFAAGCYVLVAAGFAVMAARRA